MKLEVLWKLAILTTVVAAVTATVGDDHYKEMDEGRGKKGDKMMQELMQTLMLFKNMVSFGLMFVSPIIQVKGFGLSVINTLINIGRFLVQLQATQEMKHMHMSHLKVHYAHPHQTHDSEDLWSAGSDSRYAYYAPPPKQLLSHDTGVLDNSPSFQNSYTPQPTQHYPQFSPNVAKLR